MRIKTSNLQKLSAPAILLLSVSQTSCINLNLPEEVSLLPFGTSFVVQGVARAHEPDTCYLWDADIGQTLVLFQDADIPNVDFDLVKAAGTRSRLMVRVRDDLDPLCDDGDVVVEVEEVLEIGG